MCVLPVCLCVETAVHWCAGTSQATGTGRGNEKETCAGQACRVTSLV